MHIYVYEKHFKVRWTSICRSMVIFFSSYETCNVSSKCNHRKWVDVHTRTFMMLQGEHCSMTSFTRDLARDEQQHTLIYSFLRASPPPPSVTTDVFSYSWVAAYSVLPRGGIRYSPPASVLVVHYHNFHHSSLLHYHLHTLVRNIVHSLFLHLCVRWGICGWTYISYQTYVSHISHQLFYIGCARTVPSIPLGSSMYTTP